MKYSYFHAFGLSFQGFEEKLWYHQIIKCIKNEKHNAGIVAKACSETQISHNISIVLVPTSFFAIGIH